MRCSLGLPRCALSRLLHLTAGGRAGPYDFDFRRVRHRGLMSLKCWSRREYRELDISEFAIIKAEQKYVIGVMPDGTEWFLPHKTSVETVELAAPQFIRASRSVLVAPPISWVFLAVQKNEFCIPP